MSMLGSRVWIKSSVLLIGDRWPKLVFEKGTPRCSRALSRSPNVRSPYLLPSLDIGEPSRSGLNSPIYGSPRDKSRSRFHSGCRDRQSIYLDWSAVKIDKKNPGKVPARGKTRSMTSFKDAEELEVAQYLDQNREFLENYIIEKISVQNLEKWITIKTKNNCKTPTSPNRELMKREKKKKMDKIPKKQHFMTPRCSRALSRSPNVRSPYLLPPLDIGEPSRSGLNSPIYGSPRDKSRSRFHSGCRDRQSIYLDWSAVKIDKKNPGKVPARGKTRSMTSFKDAEELEVAQYLDQNREFLENYIIEKVSVQNLEKWITIKTKNNCKTSTSPNRELMKREKKKTMDKIPKKQHFMDLLNNLKADPTEQTVLQQLADYIVSSVGVDAYRIYKLYPDHPTFVQYFVSDYEKSQNRSNLVRANPEDVAMVLKVALQGSCCRLSRENAPLDFPMTPVSLFKELKKDVQTRANHVMYQPILSKTGKTVYVIEMWRMKKFEEVDEEISSNFMVLGSLALHYCNLYLDKKRERNMSDFLLDVVKGIFEEMVSLDQLIKIILEFAQRLVNADRASLFLVDYRNYELVSTVFDLKFEQGQDRDIERKEIRIPINRGIAGHVALSGETMNIPDAYSDHRFNREVDEATGYKTVSILCMPIKVEGSVIGVVQMVNKREDENFGHEDEVAFEIFSTFFGLALHHARLYDRIMRKEQKYRVALEVLSYHNTCREAEVMAMLSNPEPTIVDLNNYYLDPYKFDELEKCKFVVKMFSDLFDLSNFDLSTLTRFVLTVKKNYRAVPYHNFDHGWTVAHTMYVMLKNDHRQRFNYKMRLALFVACLCHDLDHRGYTNKYMCEIASPLAAMYTTSTLEHHHFNITVTILQQDGHNIFSHITSKDYKEILGFIRHCILATDLAKFFPNLEKLNQLYAEKPYKFDWNLDSHRDLAMAISMTAADLSASAKPWKIQIKTVKVIFEEFYDQGDKERAAGREPIPMMDRNKPDEQPSSQVGFLKQICIPCYSILHCILPNTSPMYVMSLKNLERWKLEADIIQQKLDRAKIKTHSVKEEGDEKDIFIEGKEIEGNERNIPKGKGKKRDSNEKGASKKEGKEEDVVGSCLDTFDWDKDEQGTERVVSRSAIWKNIDGVMWIDEEGVVVAKNALKPTVNKEE